MVELYPSIPHDRGLEVLRKQYNKFKDKMVLTEYIINILCLTKVFLNLIENLISKYQKKLSGLNLRRGILAFLWTIFKPNS